MNKQRVTLFLLKVVIFSTLLSAIALPEILAQINPLWMLLLYTYWLINFEAKGRLLIALVLGVLLDIMQGDILGQNALALVLASAFVLNVKQSFYVSNLSTQQVYVFGAASIYLLSMLGVHVLTQGFSFSYWLLLTPLSSALVWPIVRLLLAKCRH